VIDRIDSPSCGCIDAKLDDLSLDAGSETTLHLRPSIAGVRGMRALRLRFHSKSHGDWETVLEGVFVHDYLWAPPQIDFLKIAPGEERAAQAILYLSRTAAQPLTMPAFDAGPGVPIRVAGWQHLATEVYGDMAIDQYVVQVELRVTDPSPAEESAAVLAVRDAEGKTRADLRIRWVVQPLVRVMPETIGFVGGATQKRYVLVQSSDGVPFRIVRAGCDVPWAIVEPPEGKKVARHRLEIKLRAEHAPNGAKPCEARLRMKLDHPKCSHAEVTVTWLP
jgi:hypothetical protein